MSGVHDVVTTVINDIQTWVDMLPRALQVVAVFVLSVIPVVEGDIAAGIGMVAGIDWELTFLAATAGTVVAAWVTTLWGTRIAAIRQTRRAARRAERAEQEAGAPDEVDGRHRNAAVRLLRQVDRYGLGPAMVLCGFISPIAVNCFVLALAGYDRKRLLVWSVVSAVINVGVVVAGATGLLHILL
ncbi:hypothetical protein [Corynebacterium nuruki]|uniref:hypothetical protein n=1 Tax=Corynebacterium nuruki TaxID=1032851 RepID=UPI000301EB94|nr:hypothetical protein [Corynebacterium nuruki]